MLVVGARVTLSRRHSYLAGEDMLDPQYGECLQGVSDDDLKRYFEPVALSGSARGADRLESGQIVLVDRSAALRRPRGVSAFPCWRICTERGYET